MKLHHLISLILLLLFLSACSHLTPDLAKSSESSLENESSASTDPSLADDGSTDTITGEDPIGGDDKAESELEADSLATRKIQTDLDEALELCELSQNYWQEGELENALDALDRAYALILSVDNSNQPKLIQQKEDLRFMISKRILEIYASRHIVVNGNHNAIPIAMNRHVQAEIDLFTKGGERRFFIESYRRSGLYRNLIVRELRAAGKNCHGCR